MQSASELNTLPNRIVQSVKAAQPQVHRSDSFRDSERFVKINRLTTIVIRVKGLQFPARPRFHCWGAQGKYDPQHGLHRGHLRVKRPIPTRYQENCTDDDAFSCQEID